MLSTKAFTDAELAEAKRELAEVDVTNRYDQSNAYVMLGQIGMALVIAADRYPDDPALRAAAAKYTTWRNLPKRPPAVDTGGDLA